MNSPLVYISLTGMFLSVLLFFYNKGYQSAKSYLAGFLLLSSFFLFMQCVYLFSNDLHIIIWFIAGLPSLFYLIGPFAYLYVRSILRDNTKLSRLDYLHFLIFFLVLIGAIPYIVSNLEHKLTLAKFIQSNDWSTRKFRPNAIFPPIVNQILRLIHLLAYSILIWLIIYKQRVKLFKNTNHTREFEITKKWIFLFSSYVFLLAIFHIIIYYTASFSKTKTIFLLESNSLLFIYSVLYIFIIGVLLFFPHILYGLPVKIFFPSENLMTEPSNNITKFESKEVLIDVDITDEVQLDPITDKYVKLFSEDYLQEITCKLNTWKDQNHFLDPETNISTLAVQIKIPQHHLSYYFNTILAIKFTDWRNHLKIEYAVSLIEQENHKNLTLEALSIQCGFLSQSTFIRAFKNAKGMTPSEYMKGGGGRVL